METFFNWLSVLKGEDLSTKLTDLSLKYMGTLNKGKNNEFLTQIAELFPHLEGIELENVDSGPGLVEGIRSVRYSELL